MAQHLRSTRHAMLCLFFLAFLSACAQVGIPTPDTFNKRLLATVAVVTQVEQTAAQLLHAGAIGADDGQNILDQTARIVVGLNVARAMSVTDIAGADARLTSAHTALVALQAYLNTRGAKP